MYAGVPRIKPGTVNAGVVNVGDCDRPGGCVDGASSAFAKSELQHFHGSISPHIFNVNARTTPLFGLENEQ
jgi:hypothetical protein